jgi:TolA-binding protein
MKSFMLILFAIVLTNVVAESENKEQILRRLQNLEEIVQDERVINTQQQLTIDRQNTVIQNLESEIDRLNGKVKENSSGMIS